MFCSPGVCVSAAVVVAMVAVILLSGNQAAQGAQFPGVHMSSTPKSQHPLKQQFLAL